MGKSVYDTASTIHTNMSRVQEFYAGKNIFITGGTGFLGKVLIEKLVRSSPDIGTIYVLIRARKDKSAEERIEELVANTVFNVVRSTRPESLKKIVGIAGDITEKELGLSAADRARIIDEVSVILHLAASVRFNEALDKAIITNVNPTKDLVEIAKECKNLEAGIYVSTAYSHCVRKFVDEELYEPPLSYEEANEFVQDMKNGGWSEDTVQSSTARLLGKWPNTYSFTKAIAEGVVAKYAKDIPFAIFRPSMVTASYTEPFPGWVDNLFSVHGVMIGMGTGVIHTMRIRKEAIVDLVPVDMVCNALIVSAWKTAVTKRRNSEDLPVYNYVSGPENPISWDSFYSMCTKYAYIKPVLASVYYHSVIIVNTRWLFMILNFFLHMIPAILADTALRLLGKEPKYYKLYKKVITTIDALTFFCIHEWTFRNQRVQNLWKAIDDKDKETYPFNLRNLDWTEKLERQIDGLRQYVLKESDDILDKARQRQFHLYVIHTIVRLVTGTFILWITWKLLCGRSLVINAQSVS